MTIHIISHTHWDREWFLSAEHTTAWSHDLFQRLFKVIDACPDYQYLLDGQTLMIEDYLQAHPEQRERLQRYAAAGHLLIGPYYGQIDWRAVSEEALMRNLYFGINDAQGYGNLMPCGWAMDNFGHCSQAPQIHRHFGIQDIFLWRGPVFEDDQIASDFRWQGSDGSELRASYLMSGYRNFYNLTDTTEFLQQRVDQLSNMLTPFTPHQQLIFLNGYDLDVFPEDPFTFLENKPPYLRSTPERYIQACRASLEQSGESLPQIRGELYSGKYACVFPGSLSARSYLRVENALIERLLAYYLEPLQALLTQAGVPVDSAQAESFWRDLLKTQLHDNLGGVGIDQIHRSMEDVYQRLYTAIHTGIKDALTYLPSILDLQRGGYVFMPSPFAYDNIWLNGSSAHYRVSSSGTGIARIEDEQPSSGQHAEIADYSWTNDFYTCEITSDGVTLNGKPVGQLVLERDAGDTYNADPEPFESAPCVTITSMTLLEEHQEYAKIGLTREISHEGIQISTEEELFLSNTPLLNWKISVDSWGSGYRLRMTYASGDSDSDVFAKMPYDIYQRPRRDDNYFGDDIPQELRPILLAARETGSVADFPFQGFVALSSGTRTHAFCAKGAREYEVDQQGTISITLRRSVEWLAKSTLRTRLGDAGPYMYVPEARDERKTDYEAAFLDISAAVRSPEFLRWFYLFEYGFLAFENQTFKGTRTEARLWNETLPWSGMQAVKEGQVLLRFYNPYAESATLSKTYSATDPFGIVQRPMQQISPNELAQIVYEPEADTCAPVRVEGTQLREFPAWPVSASHAAVDPAKLDELREKIEELTHEQQQARQRLSQLSEEQNALEYHRAKHAEIRLDRELLELELSIALNEETAAGGATPEGQEKIRTLGERLNFSRRQRRTYDYILSLFENQ